MIIVKKCACWAPCDQSCNCVHACYWISRYYSTLYIEIQMVIVQWLTLPEYFNYSITPCNTTHNANLAGSAQQTLTIRWFEAHLQCDIPPPIDMFTKYSVWVRHGSPRVRYSSPWFVMSSLQCCYKFEFAMLENEFAKLEINIMLQCIVFNCAYRVDFHTDYRLPLSNYTSKNLTCKVTKLVDQTVG
jgi:hypothetical protein